MRRSSRSTFPLRRCPACRALSPCGGRSRSSPGTAPEFPLVFARDRGTGAPVRPRGFSLRELGLTLLLLAVVIVAAVRLIDLRTKLLVVEKDDPGLGSVLEAAARALSRDVTEADRGARYEDASGAAVVVRAGTDQLGLRGVLRTPLLAVRLSRGTGGGGESALERIPADASSVWFRLASPSGSGDAKHADEPRAVAGRLEAATRRAKRFFLVADRAGRSAVALVREWRGSKEADAAL